MFFHHDHQRINNALICIINGAYQLNHPIFIKPLAAHLGDGRQAIWHVGELQAGRGGQVAGELARDLRGDVASDMVMSEWHRPSGKRLHSELDNHHF